jgi:hypothetical protein
MSVKLLAIQKSNIQLITSALWQEARPHTREGLRQLLITEEYKYGISLEHLRMAHQIVVFSRNRLVQQEQMIAQFKNRGADTTIIEQTLTNIKDAHELHVNFYERVARKVDYLLASK